MADDHQHQYSYLKRSILNKMISYLTMNSYE